MPARVLDGKALAETMRVEIAQQVAAHVALGHRPPGLAAVLVGNVAASRVYVRNKRRACDAAGIRSWLYELPEECSSQQLLDLVAQLNADAQVDGILVQLPLPKQIDEQAVIEAILPDKDVDGFHPDNVGRLTIGIPRFLPCTPYGVQQILQREGIDTAGKRVAILGRSNIVGKPMALILMQKPSKAFPMGGDATVTILHSRSRDLVEQLRQADILIAGIGVAHFVQPEMVKPGAVIIDVGINSLEGKIVGDVAPGVAEIASAMTPVPGGVGPMTITMLLQNTLEAARIHSGLSPRETSVR
ncbi:bifunctional 5,10-methylenetetrahydrofolate dehydrogenase/5,10-methenyltetrahydrofolate cyclohydrolase [Tuwongella immobilis]|uniref:Bifunctional protein FolD n=1 Tax=Tuwongella immobilis TaxID=692036 RepID=A0A6C2YQE5_9BACT|nr:bifunctional 5,10-methylenetetrahydrofolate dehydrogenase/5,10-methenyltetrahydrofolate cyclohydrolase [Tuwongella immobilis]VIP03235.1 -methylene-tetrahydrofolate dehydrogenase : Bifunctional protein FolD OS=Blastopirellula marina DSM 3645 GN=folD PE=3 SV=1: THF_DHG_CYH: THF_DHG_CYH_C [Tuwongella immobilis]VTS03792.1 -methylene-tetrahydrofolate dehydrogenase : Bifunctional protein FolD OS=Blastopirellula marina DSM 3645 GN=folD PE=3 SV=1: THF_DHG_CYH: THF_DHG_CYH_C [Tuwongella immobilis]